jgi:hypothetical protein
VSKDQNFWDLVFGTRIYPNAAEYLFAIVNQIAGTAIETLKAGNNANQDLHIVHDDQPVIVKLCFDLQENLNGISSLTAVFPKSNVHIIAKYLKNHPLELYIKKSPNTWLRVIRCEDRLDFEIPGPKNSPIQFSILNPKRSECTSEVA